MTSRKVETRIQSRSFEFSGVAFLGQMMAGGTRPAGISVQVPPSASEPLEPHTIKTTISVPIAAMMPISPPYFRTSSSPDPGRGRDTTPEGMPLLCSVPKARRRGLVQEPRRQCRVRLPPRVAVVDLAAIVGGPLAVDGVRRRVKDGGGDDEGPPTRRTVYSSAGFGADGVARVAFVDEAGDVVAETPVVDNTYSFDPAPSGENLRIAAFSISGERIFEQPKRVSASTP